MTGTIWKAFHSVKHSTVRKCLKHKGGSCKVDCCDIDNFIDTALKPCTDSVGDLVDMQKCDRGPG